MTDSTLTDEAPEALYPITFVIEAARIGRYREFGSLEVTVEESPWPLAEALARAIRKEVEPYLLTDKVEVWVDMRRGLFEINRGRFGRGSFHPADPDEEVQ